MTPSGKRLLLPGDHIIPNNLTMPVQLVGPSLLRGDSGINLLTVARALGLRGLDASGARASHERRYVPSRLKAYSLWLLVPPGPRA